MTLSNKIICAALNYQRLDEKALSNLQLADLKNDSEFLNQFKNDIGLNIDSIAVIKKCNAVMLLISYQDDLSFEYLRGRMLSTWDSHAHGGIMSLIRDIKFYDEINAIKFLGECAVGIHSVTIGDSQVLSQIAEGLKSGIHGAGSPFVFIADWLNELANECKLKTSIFEGNTSLERIASELVVKNIPEGKKSVLIGYGKSGNLVAKILNVENALPLHIVNRTIIDVPKENLNETSVQYSSFADFKSSEDITCIIIALDNNAATNRVVGGLLNKIDDLNRIFFVDLSTPSLLAGKVSSFIGIEKLSEIAENNVGARKNEISKAKSIIDKKIDVFVDQINRNVAKLYINQQRQSNFKKLDKDKLDLVSQRSKMYKIIRNYLDDQKFLEVTTPYIVGLSTDPPKVDKGGTINVDWMNGAPAFLRQSNQIYKQILVASGLEKIYEIGPFWRKETSESYRHLQESIGLDIELKNPKNLENLYYLACQIIKKTNDDLIKTFSLTSHLVLPEIDKIPVLTYCEAVKLLQENGNPVTMGDDLGLVSEAKLGQLIKSRNASDIFIIKDYPDTIKKFYTKNKSGGLTETFDIIVDGWELVSGAVRQTDGEQIKKSMLLSGINISDYEFYISIVDKAVDHGGFCLGLDRLIAKILAKEMISDAVPFPRTYKRLIP